MAESTLKLTLEEKNYWKFCMLNVKVVPDAIRTYFDVLILPTNLATSINQHYPEIVGLINKKVINAVQRNILQRIPGTVWPPNKSPVPSGHNATSSADFDVSLLVCLLRNIPLPGICSPVTGWNDLPYPNDKSPGAHIARLKYYRNELAHGIEHQMNTSDFENKWTSISEAIHFCYGGHSPPSLIHILHYDHDANVVLMSEEMNAIKRDLELIRVEKDEMQKELDNVQNDFDVYKGYQLPKNISDTNQDLIDKWRIEDNPFFTTRDVKLAYDWLEYKNIVILIGHSGSGKSAAARHVALQWHAYGYDIVPVEFVEKILEYRCKKKKQIFIIDDVIGKYSVNSLLLNQWERLDEKLRILFDDNNAKLICTLRKVLAFDDQFRSSKTIISGKARIFDLDHLLPVEKRSILKNHLINTNRQNDISDISFRECIIANFGFPLLCHMFTTNDELFELKHRFFQKPFSYLNEEIAMLYHRNKEIYCSLVVCMMFAGNLTEQMIPDSDEKNEILKMLSMISNACGLKQIISKQTVFDSMKAVTGVYIQIYSGRYSFSHDSVLEAMSFHFSKVEICLFFKFCRMEFLVDRVRVISAEDNDDQSVIVVHEDYYCHLAYRFIKELMNGNFRDVLCSQPIEHSQFIKELGRIIDKEELITKQMLFKVEYSWRHGWHFLYGFSRSQHRNAMEVIMKTFPRANTLLHWVIVIGCHNLFDFFWKSTPQNQQTRYLREYQSLFPLALLSGCKEIINTMLDSGADVNSPGNMFALRRLLMDDRDFIEIFNIFIDTKTEINSVYHNRKSLLFYAISSKDWKTVALLVEKDSGKNALLEAVFNSNMKKTNELLVGCELNMINFVSNYGWSVFHFAAYNNDIAMMKLIFNILMKRFAILNQSFMKPHWYKDTFVTIVKCDTDGWSPLHVACVLQNYEAVEFLVSKLANIYLVDLDGKTPLHFSCDERMTALLLEQIDRANEPTSMESTKMSKDNKHSFGERYQHLEDSQKDTCETIDKIRTIKYKEKNKRIYSKEVIRNQSLFALIYVTCMNILFINFSIVKFRTSIDRPDRKGNTILHSHAMMETNDGRMKSLKMLLARGASPLLYNMYGCRPSDVTFERQTNQVKRFLDLYSRLAAKMERRIVVFVSILIFLLVVIFCLASSYVCTDFESGNSDKFFYYDCIYYMIGVSHCTLPSNNITYLVKIPVICRSMLGYNQFLKLLPFCSIHQFSIFCVLILHLFWALGKTLLRRHKYYSCEYISIFVCSNMLILLISCLFYLIIWGLLLCIIIFFYQNWRFYRWFVKVHKNRKSPVILNSWDYTIILDCLFPCMPVICLPFFDAYGSLLISILRLAFSRSTIIHLLSFILSFIGIYIYIYVFPGCIYLILLKLWEKSKGFGKFLDRLQLNILNALHIPRDSFCSFNKPSFKWKGFIQYILLFILLIFEIMIFNGTYRNIVEFYILFTYYAVELKKQCLLENT